MTGDGGHVEHVAGQLGRRPTRWRMTSRAASMGTAAGSPLS